MAQLSTIQKRENLNQVFSEEQIEPGGACHNYLILSNEADANGAPLFNISIPFQKGSRKEENSRNGILDTDLLEIVRDRMKSFQAGSFSSDYNQKALEHIEEALMWLNRRVEDRIERNVLGTNTK